VCDPSSVMSSNDLGQFLLKSRLRQKYKSSASGR
jgi:hypothetical protein